MAVSRVAAEIFRGCESFVSWRSQSIADADFHYADFAFAPATESLHASRLGELFKGAVGLC